MGQHSWAESESAVLEIYCKCFSDALSGPSSFESYSSSDIFHLVGQKRNGDFFPRQQLIKLKIFVNDICRFSSLRQERIKFSVEISVHYKGSVVPTITTHSIEFHFNDQTEIIVRSTVKSFLHLSSLHKVISRKILVVGAGRSSESFN